MNRPSREQLWDYFILVARLLLAWTLLRYGWSKLTNSQFGVSEATLNQPLKDVDLFSLSWHLAAHEPFKSFIGVAQIITALLLLYSRSIIPGALMSIPIWLNILIWDMTFMGLYTPFTIRIPFYLLLTSLILLHHKRKVLAALETVTQENGTKYKYPVWAYLLLPILGICLELIGAIPNLIIQLLTK